MDEDNCMVDIAKFFLEFTVDESCGKCTACRLGTKRLYEMLCKVTNGKATMEDLDKMEELCYYIKDNSLCGLGQSAPNPVLSTLKYFREEYIAHVRDKRCPAGVCKNTSTSISIPTSVSVAKCALAVVPPTLSNRRRKLCPAKSCRILSSIPLSASNAAIA